MESPKCVSDIRSLIKEHQLLPKSGSYNRKLLDEGLQTIKGRVEYNKKLKESGNINLDVSDMGGWIHNLVRDTLGGKINCEDLSIEWDINNKTIKWNPISDEIHEN